MHILRFVFFRIVLISSQRVKQPQPFPVRSQTTSSGSAQGRGWSADARAHGVNVLLLYRSCRLHRLHPNDSGVESAFALADLSRVTTWERLASRGH